ncbi:hypothetical protein SEUCBS139899_000532 [Sporothrix eucalyptigena]
MDFSPHCIWGDEDETVVYAQVIGQGKAVIFRFFRDPNASRQSLAARVVNYYHRNEDPAAPSGFETRDDLREFIWSAIAAVWNECVKEPQTSEPGTLIDLSSDDNGEITWRAFFEPLFDRYIDLLRHITADDLMPRGRTNAVPIVDVSELTILSSLGGKGCSMKVQLQKSLGENSIFVFKGVDFQTYLQLYDENDEFLDAFVESWRRSSRLIATMAPHPNIQAPPQLLVSTRDPKTRKTVLVGHLSPYLPRGDLAGVLEDANTKGTLIPLQRKAKWCLQLARTVDHTHNMLHTYQMDIKPGNILVDEADNIQLIDWEQSGAPATTLAPEADGTWDVHQTSSKLVYTKYDGPGRRNMPVGGGTRTFHNWNVFPVWQQTCPKATELAEVFALGRTMWMILTQMSGVDFNNINHPDEIQVTWHDRDELPLVWVDMVVKYMERDPNSRPAIADVITFWEGEFHRWNK